MAIKFMMKNPLLMIGILFMAIFLMNLSGNNIFSRQSKIKATSCNATLVMLNKRIPATWKTVCNDNNLEITINSSSLVEKLSDINKIRPLFYRELANNLIFISKNSPIDSLERVFMVTLKMDSSKFKLSSVTEGKYLIRLRTLKSPKFIAEHLKSTVQTQELLK
jgi:hypothetical protein